MAQGNEFPNLSRVDANLLSDCADKYTKDQSLCNHVYDFVKENPGTSATIAVGLIALPFAANKAEAFARWAEQASGLVVKDAAAAAVKTAGGELAAGSERLAAEAAKANGAKLVDATVQTAEKAAEKAGTLPTVVVENNTSEAAAKAASKSETIVSRARARKAPEPAEKPAWVTEPKNQGFVDFLKRMPPKWSREPKNRGFVEWLTGRGNLSAEKPAGAAVEKLANAGVPVTRENISAAAKLVDSPLATRLAELKSPAEKAAGEVLPGAEAKAAQIAKPAAEAAARTGAKDTVAAAEAKTGAKATLDEVEEATNEPWTSNENNGGLLDFMNRSKTK